MLDLLKHHATLNLAVVTADASHEAEFQANGVDYFVIKEPWYRRVQSRFGSLQPLLPSRARVAKYAAIVRRWNPDVIHVHGTERDYGFVKCWHDVEPPLVVSLQGLMNPYSWKAFGDLSPEEVDGWLRTALGYKGFCAMQRKSLRLRCPPEQQVLRSADLVLGRTEWDKAWAWALSPGVPYRHAGELMRPEFFASQPWKQTSCRAHRIFCTTGPQPLKGLHVLLEAVAILRRTYPDIELKIASNGFVPRPGNAYARYILRRINSLDLDRSVSFLGWLNAYEQVTQLQQAHCFVTPSFIENSCNALQEAMLVGCPCVAASSGGLLTMIEHEKTGLAFPAGDVALLAHSIHRVFTDKSLATRLGTEARLTARKRADPQTVKAQLLSAYFDLCSNQLNTRTQ